MCRNGGLKGEYGSVVVNGVWRVRRNEEYFNLYGETCVRRG